MKTFTDSELEQVYHDARAIGSPEERAAFLDRACQKNDELRVQVEALLAADEQMASFMEQNAAAAVDFTIDDPVRERPGSQIGRYKLLEEIGEGGFGLVFIAQQHEPIDRRVALKVIKPGMDTREVIARFEAERQALALMDHPHIAKVLDAGTTESGRPYFVMELVRGLPITDYCDQSHLTLRDRLQLFAKLGEAVQHAHQKGIIHRDIKPSNVLVTEQDGRPTVKIIDFGVAKALDQRLSKHSVYTRLQQMIGTPVYMSPEQTGASGLDIDTRSDIYSLGVLLYELLTGNTPFDWEQLARGALQEVQRIIREEEPPKPSTKLTDSGDRLPSIAAARHTEPAKLTKVVRGELDWIVMKCLEKDRNRRYNTALGLVHDIDRYLHDEPVQASPPSRTYRLRKFARKYRVPLAVGVAFICVLALGFGIAVWQAVRATRSELLAKASAQRTERVLEYLVSAFRKPDPAIDGREVKVVDVLEQAMADANTRLKDDPLEQAALLDAIRSSFIGLGTYDPAIKAANQIFQLNREVLGEDDLQTIESMSALAVAHAHAGHLQDALAWCKRSLKASEESLGHNHPTTITCLHNLAACYTELGQLNKAIEVLRPLVDRRRSQLGANHKDTLASMNALAGCYQRSNQPQRAVPIHEEVLERATAKLGKDHPKTLLFMSGLALCYSLVGNAEKAIPLHERAVEQSQSKLGEDHHATLAAMGSYALGLQMAGQPNEAIHVYEETLDRFRESLGENHPSSLNALGNLACSYASAGQPRKAIQICEEALERKRQVLGELHPDTITMINNLASLHGQLGEYDKSLSLLEQALAMDRATLGDDHPRTLICRGNLATCYAGSGRPEKALPILEEVFPLQVAQAGPDDPHTLKTMGNLGECYSAVGQPCKALSLLERALSKTMATLGPHHEDTLITMAFLADSYRNADQPETAVSLLEKAVKQGQSSLGEHHPETRRIKHCLARAKYDAGHLDDALALMSETLRSQTDAMGDRHPSTLATRRWLARVQMRLQQHELAAATIDENLRNERERLSPRHPQLAHILWENADTLLLADKYQDAETYLRESLQIWEAEKLDNWQYFDALSLLGRAVAGQQRFDEAEPLLLNGYEGMKARAESIPRPLPTDLKTAVQRLIDFYTQTDQPEEVTRWQRELDEIQVAVDELREFAMAISVDVEPTDSGPAQAF